jgi:haloacetate dehalogenase
MTIFEKADKRLLPNFSRQIVTIEGNDVLVVIGGSGPPLLMLHGDPQTHLCWHLIAPQLAEHFTVVLTDLRGRGETHKPTQSQDHQLLRPPTITCAYLNHRTSQATHNNLCISQSLN